MLYEIYEIGHNVVHKTCWTCTGQWAALGPLHAWC